MKNLLHYSLGAAVALASCAQNSTTSTAASAIPPAGPAYAARKAGHVHRLQSPIAHVVIIVQENRSVDNLFQFLPGADTQSFGYGSHGHQVIHLRPESLTAPYDPVHTHQAWLTEYNAGGMNGFDREQCKGTCPKDAAFAYVPQSAVQEYYTLAETYTFADHLFQSDQGPTFPAHQYLVSGTSAVSDTSQNKAANNPLSPTGALVGGCDSPSGSLVAVINPAGGEPKSLKTYPCFQRRAIMNEMDDAGVTWKYYEATQGAGLYNAVDAIQSIWSNKAEMAADVVSPSSQVLTDIADGNLADVVWVTPTQADSDHPKVNPAPGRRGSVPSSMP